MTPELLPDRVLEKIEVAPSGCWLWTAGLLHDGYAALWWDGACQRAHRVIYELLVGPIPEGLEPDHTCRVKHCVNPDCLEPVTHAENVARSPIGAAPMRRARTSCPEGHPYDERDKDGRRCSRCRRSKAAERQRRYRARQASG